MIFMKHLLIFCLILLRCIFVNAQQLKFQAEKKSRVYKFPSNHPIQVMYKQDNTTKEVKCKFELKDTRGIYLSLLNNSTKEFIALDSIISVMKISETKPIGFFGNLPISVQKGWHFEIR